MQTSFLYYGGNLDILRRYLPDASVDLVYLDPPIGRIDVRLPDQHRPYEGRVPDKVSTIIAALPLGIGRTRRWPREGR